MVACPICGNEIGELPRTGDAEGFDCKQHGKFEVSRTALEAEPSKSAGRDSWENVNKRRILGLTHFR